MKHQIQILSVDFLDRCEGTVQFEIKGSYYKAFFYGEEYKLGQSVEVEFTHLESALDWNVIFNDNKEKEIKLVKLNNSEWSYSGYGKIVSLHPIIADFGDLKLDLGTWTSDPNVIGEYIYWASTD